MKSIKKRSVLLLLLMLAVFCCACGGKEETTAESEKANSEKNYVETEKKEHQEVVQESEDSVLVGTYKVPRKEVYVDIPDMHYIEKGYTQLWFEDLVKYTSFTFLKGETAENAEEAFKLTFENFKNNMSTGLHYVNYMGEVTAENTTINGIDVYAFEGVMNCGNDPVYDAYVKGYSFIYDEMPCTIMGVVMDVEQPQEQIDAIEEIVDAMILTVRNEQ